MNVLVTGATGFVGTALLKRLGREKCHVRTAVLAGARTDHLLSSVDTVIVSLLSETTEYADALRGIDVVVHLAARVHVMDEDAVDPLAEFRRVNVAGTERLARQAATAGVRRLVFLSSVKVNGEGRPMPYTEDDTPAPEDPYGVSKREAEDVLRQVAADTGLEVVIIRSPLVYGPGVKGNFRRLMEMVRRGIPLPLAWIRNSRSFIGLGNLVDAINLCVTHPRAAGNSYLVSDGEDVSTPDLVRLLAVAFGRPDRLFPFSLALIRLAGTMTGKGAVVERLAGSLTVDTSKISRELGWQPPFTMEQGLGWLKRRNGYHDRGVKHTMKRLFDFICALLACLTLSIPMLFVALLVRVTSAGPILYWSDRVGCNNVIFKMPKFRTMRIDTPAVATHLLGDPDRWLTPAGKFLRKSSLDELPQLLSILKGDMSIVGPRPALFNQNDLITLRTEKGVHQLPPGLTGWAQINGRDELPISVKVEFDEYYLNNRSFALDLRIIFLTFLKVAKSEGVTH